MRGPLNSLNLGLIPGLNPPNAEFHQNGSSMTLTVHLPVASPLAVPQEAGEESLGQGWALFQLYHTKSPPSPGLIYLFIPFSFPPFLQQAALPQGHGFELLQPPPPGAAAEQLTLPSELPLLSFTLKKQRSRCALDADAQGNSSTKTVSSL